MMTSWIVGLLALLVGVPSPPIEIRTTAYGIPHVLARDYRGLGQGAGYATAEHNLCALADIVLTTSGERSRLLGPGEGETNLISDAYHAWINQSRTVERLLPTVSAQARELVRGYAAGVNRYLGNHRAACPGVRPITEIDVWRRAYQIAGNQGGEAYQSAIINGALVPAPRPASNAIAIGRSASATGTGLLLANPHLPWNGRLRLFQQQLTIPGELDVSGAGFLGLPVVNMGHTDRMAWSHTASTAQTGTLIKLALAPGDPTSYLVDGRRQRLSRTTVSIAVRGTSPVQKTVYSHPDGPVVADPDFLPWTTESAYVLHEANADNLRIIDQYLAIARSRNVGQLHAALSKHLGVPWAFTVAADSTGAAYFSDVQVVPNVPDDLIRRCGGSLTDNPIVLDGSRSSCRWTGLLGSGRMPALTRTDSVSNMNDSAWLTNPAAPLTGYPAILGDTGTPRSDRTRLGLDMIARRIGGTDGFGPPGFTLDTLQKTALANRNLPAEQSRAAVVEMCRSLPDVRAACDVLARWDGRGNLDSRGAYLWQKYVQRAEPNPVVPFDPADPAHTPRGLVPDREAFIDVVRTFEQNGIPLDVPLGAVQHYAGIPIHGCDTGCFNVILDDRDPAPPAAMPDVNFGASFLMAVELTAHGPRARTLLTYGQSADVASPHHTDQARLYSSKQWVVDRFTAAEIQADPALRVTTLSTR